MLPSDVLNWELVCYYFAKWSRDGILEEISLHFISRGKSDFIAEPISCCIFATP